MTVPVGSTATSGSITIDNISVKELPGLHATQSTEASRPLYGIVPVSGRRNLLTQSEGFGATGWSKFGTSGTTTAATLSNGMPGFTISATGGREFYSQTLTALPAGTYTLSAFGQGATGATAVFGLFGTSSVLGTGDFTSFGRAYVQLTHGGGNLEIRVGVGLSANATASVTISGLTLETGSTPTAYQRVSTDLDVTEAGVASVGYLRFDGSTSWMVTPTITPGTDKVQVFAGVRKLSDAATGMLVELSTNLSSNAGTFYQTAPQNTAGSFGATSRGSATDVNGQRSDSSAVLGPLSVLITATHDISGDLTTQRITGIAQSNAVADKGTGDFLAYPLYIGRRGGSSLPFNGHLFPLIVRFGPNLTAARIAATEAWVATKTAGVVLP